MGWPGRKIRPLAAGGIRLCLKRRELFRTQLRALLRASVWGNLEVMYPMIISVAEVQKIQEILKEAREELTKEGIPWKDFPQGVMIETPAAVMISRELAAEVDFFSIGHQRPDPVYPGGGPAERESWCLL